MAIHFDVDELIEGLNVLERSQLPFAGSRAMNQLGFHLKTKAWPAFATRTFDRTNAFTLGALTYTHNRGDLSLEIKLDRAAPKGQDPARYLRPTSNEGPASVYVTRFSRYLKANNYMSGEYALAITRNPALANELEDGRVRRSFYQTVRSRLNAKQGLTRSGRKSKSQYADFRFFAVDSGEGDPRLRRFAEKPGIYRVKDGAPTRIFAFLDQLPSVNQKWSFSDFAEKESRKILPSLLKKTLDEALG